MTILGLDVAIWVVLALYFAGMLALGWWSKRQADDSEGYLLGHRQFGTWYMTMHAFGAGTNPTDTTGTITQTATGGASGIWVSWMWMFGTPFYWLIAPICRRMRYLTLADYYRERFGRGAALLYTLIASVAMTIFFASVLLATCRTVQGMMGKGHLKPASQCALRRGGERLEETKKPKKETERLPSGVTVTRYLDGEGKEIGREVELAARRFGVVRFHDAFARPYAAVWVLGRRVIIGDEGWFLGILLVTTVVFVVYGYWGGIVAAIRTDMIQGLMIIVLSFLAIPLALGMKEVRGVSGTRRTLADASRRVNAGLAQAVKQHEAGDVQAMLGTLEATRPYDAAGTCGDVLDLWAKGKTRQAVATLRQATEPHRRADYLTLAHPLHFSLAVVILLSIQAPLSALALPHLMSVTSAGRTEWEGRVGFTGGNLLKRVCTIGWSVLGLAWLAYLISTGSDIRADTAFGDAIRKVLPTILQGVMLACVMAASMSSGDAVQVTVAGLFTQSLYREYIRPQADDRRCLRFTKITGVAIIAASLLIAIAVREELVKAIMAYFRILGFMGISTALGILWRRMNQTGVFASALAAVAVFLVTHFAPGCPKALAIGLPLLAGVVFGIVGSLVSRRPKPEAINRFFTRIYVPVGQEDKLELPLEEAVPPQKRLCTAGGLFLVKPSRQSWVGFLVTLAICLACVGAMLLILG